MVNKVILIGHVGKDPDMRNLDNGSTVANFTIATSENFTNKQGDKISNTEWHRIVVWGKLAEMVEKYVTKGKALYVEGKITYRSYESDGIKKYTTDIVAHTIRFIGKKELSTEVKEAPNENKLQTSDPKELEVDNPLTPFQ